MQQASHNRIFFSHIKFGRAIICLLLAVVLFTVSPCRALSTPIMEVSAYNQVRDRYTNMIYYNIKIRAIEELDISKLMIGYLITEDTSIPIPNFYCDYCGVVGNNQNINITSKVNGWIYLYNTPKNPKYVYCMEVSFDEDAGFIYENSTLELKVRMAKPDWSIFDQANDWSFIPHATDYESDWDRFIVRYDGVDIEFIK